MNFLKLNTKVALIKFDFWRGVYNNNKGIDRFPLFKVSNYDSCNSSNLGLEIVMINGSCDYPNMRMPP